MATATKKAAAPSATPKPAKATKQVDTYCKSAVTGEYYAGKPDPELIAAMDADGTVLAHSQTLRDEYGKPGEVVWSIAPTLDPGVPVPGEYRLVTAVKVERDS